MMLEKAKTDLKKKFLLSFLLSRLMHKIFIEILEWFLIVLFE